MAQRQEQKVSPVYEASLILLGQPGSGKTSLKKKLLDERYQVPNDLEEVGAEACTESPWTFPYKQSPDINVNANILDFSS